MNTQTEQKIQKKKQNQFFMSMIPGLLMAISYQTSSSLDI